MLIMVFIKKNSLSFMTQLNFFFCNSVKFHAKKKAAWVVTHTLFKKNVLQNFDISFIFFQKS